MATSSAILLICYAFVAGIGFSMAWDLGAVVAAGCAAGGALALAVAAWMRRRGMRAAARQAVETAAAIGLGLGSGMARHIAAVARPDAHWAEVAVDETVARLERTRTGFDTGRIRLELLEPPASDLAIRLVGEVDARLPAGEGGSVAADEGGRWRFRMATLTVTTDAIRVRSDDPVGREWWPATPLTRLIGVVLSGGRGPARLRVWRVAGQIGAFARAERRQPPLRVLGHVSGDPIVYDYKTVLPVTPSYIEWPAGGPFLRAEGGLIHVTIRPEAPGYAEMSGTAAYGRLIEVTAPLQAPAGARNPGGFDYRRYLRNSGVQALMYPDVREGGAGARLVEAGRPGVAPHRHAWVAFSLNLRDRLTRVIKATLPWPQSAFVGGVTLGLRYGLQNVLCLRRTADAAGGPGIGCPEFIADEFRAAGISHVLAVSGLHVTIITVMFVGLFSLARLPRQVYAPLILAALVVFAIVTGARPSTLRAVIMNGLMLTTWAYLRTGLRASVLFGAPVAAALILLHNPLVATDPSFTLSFGAILSLGLLTEPVLELLQGLRGWRLIGAVLAAAGWAAATALRWPLAATPQFWGPMGAMTAALLAAGRALDRRGPALPRWVAADRAPKGVLTFVAAQGAIQVGMMLPLSAYYFCRWPLAGAWANLAAIPLIGVIVQLGAIGGLLGLIPVVGPYLALLFGAANWFFSTLFLLLGHAAAWSFPYPFVRRPGEAFLAAWYGLCALWIWRRPLRAALEAAAARIGAGPAAARAWMAVVAALMAGAAAVRLAPERPGGLRVTWIAVDYGGATLLETPSGRRVLVDAAFADADHSRRNQAVRTLLPFLASRRIRAVDALILTSLRPERIGGAGSVLESLWVREVALPAAWPSWAEGTTPDEVAAVLGLPLESPLAAAIHDAVVGSAGPFPRPSLVRELARRRPTPLNRWAGWDVRVRRIAAGDVLYQETGPDGEFRIEVAHPPAETDLRAGPDAVAVALRVVYGDTALLLTGDLGLAEAAAMAGRLGAQGRGAQIVTAPHHGAPPGLPAERAAAEAVLDREIGALLRATGARTVIAEFGRSAGVPGGSPRSREAAAAWMRMAVTSGSADVEWLSTEEGSIAAESDGRTWRGPQQSGAGGDEADEAPAFDG